jgi:osmotically-inducible protein OsmY
MKRMASESLDAYDAEHIREQLIADPRTNALDVQVSLSGSALVLTGHVISEDRRRVICDVVAELAPGVEIRDDLSVTDLTEPQGSEVIS